MKKFTVLILILVIFVGVVGPVGVHIANAFGHEEVSDINLVTSLLLLYDPLGALAKVWQVAGAVFDFVIASIGVLMLLLYGWILWASGILLTLVFEHTVVNMSDYIASSGVTAGWKAFRDLANMFFIFILLYISIGTILQLGGVDTKKLLRNVIIVALLINFSLFFTKLIIDASNIVTIFFYNHITSAAGGNLGFAGPFMQRFGITSLFSVKDSYSILTAGGGGFAQIFLIGSGGSIFLATAAVVFFAVSIIFIIRFVMFVFLLVTSPLAFAAMALPRDSYSGRWWGRLFKEAIFAPVFMALIWVVLQILDNILVDQQGITWATMFAGAGNGKAAPSAVALILNFVIIITLLIAALIISRTVGASGSKTAIGLGRWAGGKLGRGAIRGYGVGQLPTLASNILGTKGRGIKGRVGRGLSSIGKYTKYADLAELDERLRQTKLGNLPVGIGSGVLDVTTGALVGTKFGGASVREAKLAGEKAAEARDTISKRKAFMAAVKKARQEAATAEGVSEDTEREEQRQLGRLSPKEFLDYMSENMLYDPNIMRFATHSQFAAVMKSNKYTDDKKSAMFDAHYKYQRDILEDYIEKREAWEKGVVDGSIDPNDIEAQKRAGATISSKHRDWWRAKTQEELSLIKENYPEFFKNDKTVGLLTTKQIQGLRENVDFGSEEVGDIRMLKYQETGDAGDALLGIDFSSDEWKRKTHNEREDVRKARRKNGLAIEKITDSVKETLKQQNQTEEAIDRALENVKRIHKIGEKLMPLALGGKSVEEIVAMRHRMWKRGEVVDYFDNTIANGFRGKKDTGEINEDIGLHLVKQIEAERLTKPNQAMIRWILKTKEGQTFLTNLDSEQGKIGGKTPREWFNEAAIKYDLN